jgi:DNA invertase Pin-like site-specific DNA recombinase
MSTDHQRYSTENQADALQRYADAHGMRVVRTYEDSGKSGLNVEGRLALTQLLDDVITKRADFEVLLVYDVSRWGRFQDADESAHYEYLCRRAGVRVIYCAEQFDNDGSPLSALVKSIKRTMAGEYSRELSSKVFIGQCRLVELGFRQGGAPGFGLRRLLVDAAGSPKGVLGRGEQKSLQTDRVLLVPGPPEEIAVVQRIYRLFVVTGMIERAIAEVLNAEGVLTDLGRAWTRGTVHQVLTNEKYIGNNVYNRSSFKLKQRHIHNPPESWIRADGVYQPVVDQETFQQARKIILRRSHRLGDEDMLQALRTILEKAGTLSGLVIDEQEGMPSSGAYRSRFGSLLRAYRLVGFRPQRDYRYVKINRALRELHPDVVGEVVAGLEQDGGSVRQREDGLLVINEEFSISVIIARCQQTEAGAYRWRLRLDTSLKPDITVAVRMDATNRHRLDYFLFPHLDIARQRLRLTEQNSRSLDSYRFETLDILYSLSARERFSKVA